MIVDFPLLSRPTQMTRTLVLRDEKRPESLSRMPMGRLAAGAARRACAAASRRRLRFGPVGNAAKTQAESTERALRGRKWRAHGSKDASEHCAAGCEPRGGFELEGGSGPLLVNHVHHTRTCLTATESACHSPRRDPAPASSRPPRGTHTKAARRPPPRWVPARSASRAHNFRWWLP